MPKLPINKRWPGKWVIKASIYTPKGTKIDVETDLPDQIGEKVMELVGQALRSPEKKLPKKTAAKRHPVNPDEAVRY